MRSLAFLRPSDVGPPLPVTVRPLGTMANRAQRGGQGMGREKGAAVAVGRVSGGRERRAPLSSSSSTTENRMGMVGEWGH